MSQAFPYIENVPRMKVVELKEQLSKRGLDISGLKKDVSLMGLLAYSVSAD